MKIRVVDMHTSGEPTRIVVQGYPELKGSTLLEKRADARDRLDHVRQLLMKEPRGHSEMYGAILVWATELTAAGRADVGVLFCHNEGYSTMCGHAAIALGRFLVDMAEGEFLARIRSRIADGCTKMNLHAPCGIVEITVPVTPQGRADATRPVTFLSVPSFVGGTDISVHIPADKMWKQIRESGRQHVKVAVAFGGAFYVIVDVRELGFADGLLASSHPSERDLEYLYGVIICDEGVPGDGVECGVCFFADGQIDRSPTGSGVCARVALAVVNGGRKVGEGRVYESMYSMRHAGSGFAGTAVEEVSMPDGRSGVTVRVSGRAHYVGATTFVLETGDGWKHGL
ncbi:hypothetical protein PLEOSDRAFT_51003 [Pleurotus ostreatus PC15]|uniref:trans-L-3-hydroxyproline dehydratase n=1 Tax=Pleurotus ostreatus (strain PC15) TaxID=1137138 RepID=A0A067NUR2_PLEO1|nr:hypothetical protein PLEOSDRAFT_51003 [Pleurotus ostreatus PC15]